MARLSMDYRAAIALFCVLFSAVPIQSTEVPIATSVLLTTLTQTITNYNPITVGTSTSISTISACQGGNCKTAVPIPIVSTATDLSTTVVVSTIGYTTIYSSEADVVTTTTSAAAPAVTTSSVPPSSTTSSAILSQTTTSACSTTISSTVLIVQPVSSTSKAELSTSEIGLSTSIPSSVINTSVLSASTSISPSSASTSASVYSGLNNNSNKQSSHTLSTGAKAGIGIVCAFAAISAVLLAFYLGRSQSKTRSRSPTELIPAYSKPTDSSSANSLASSQPYHDMVAAATTKHFLPSTISETEIYPGDQTRFTTSAARAAAHNRQSVASRPPNKAPHNNRQSYPYDDIVHEINAARNRRSLVEAYSSPWYELEDAPVVPSSNGPQRAVGRRAGTRSETG